MVQRGAGGRGGGCFYRAENRITPEIDPHSGAEPALQCWVSMPQRTPPHHTLIPEPTAPGSLKLPGEHTHTVQSLHPALLPDLSRALKLHCRKNVWKLTMMFSRVRKVHETSWEFVLQHEVKVNLITGLPVLALKLPTASSGLITSKCCCLQLNRQGNHLYLCGTMKMTNQNKTFFSVL